MSYTLTDIMNNPNIGIEIGKEIESMSWIKSPFEPLVGQGSDRGIRSYQIANKQPFRPRLKARLTGMGVQDNEEFQTNYDEMEILNQTIYPKISGNGLLSPVFHYSEMQFIDFEKEAKDSLATWMMDTRDKQFIAALTNDLTNCVVADAKNGYKDTTAETSVKNASKKIQKGDTISVKAIRRAIFLARTGIDYKNKEIFPLKPIRAQSMSNGGISTMHYSYIIMLDSYGIQQLKNDEEWRDM
ncbi:MAG: structural protein, partial [Helicobacter sp.]|nr:structural protein [Helicobacter sp.]